MKNALLYCLLLAGCALGCRHHEPVESEAPPAKVEGNLLTLPDTNSYAAPLSTMLVKKTAANTLTFNGRLTWDDDVTVRVFTPFGGRVTKILAEVGQKVDREAPLALIASPDFGQAQSDARRAESDLILAERAVERSRDLYAHGAAAKKDLDSTEADLSRARTEHERAVSRLEFYGGSTNGVDQIYPLKSPLTGVVVEKNITPGQEVRADQMLANAPQFVSPLFVVTDPARLWIQVDATELESARLKAGDKIIIRSASLPDKAFSGQLDLVSESLDPANHTIKVRGSVDNSMRKLKAEMFVTVELTDPGLSELQVPAKAVFLQGDRHFIFVEEKTGTFRRREVTVGEDHNGSVTVLSGLEAGERVVCEGSLLLEQTFESVSDT